MMQEVPNQYEIKQSPDNENRTLERKNNPWEEKVDKEDEKRIGFLSSVLNPDRLKIYSSDQSRWKLLESWNSPDDLADLRKGVNDNRREINRIRKLLEEKVGLEERITNQVLGDKDLRQMEEFGSLTDPSHIWKEVFSDSKQRRTFYA